MEEEIKEVKETWINEKEERERAETELKEVRDGCTHDCTISLFSAALHVYFHDVISF